VFDPQKRHPSLIITILGGAIGSAFGCYDRKVQATGRFLVRSQAEEDEELPFAHTIHTCVGDRISFCAHRSFSSLVRLSAMR
jgi:hypothetical protein